MMFKQTATVIFGLILGISFAPLAWAQQFDPRTDSPYVENFYYSPDQDGRLYFYRDPMGYAPPPSAVSQAWDRQWGPIEQATGITSNTVRDFIAGMRSKVVDVSASWLSGAKDWGLILADSGMLATFGEVSRDTFFFTIRESSQYLFGDSAEDVANNYNLVPHWWGSEMAGDQYYAPEALNYPYPSLDDVNNPAPQPAAGN